MPLLDKSTAQFRLYGIAVLNGHARVFVGQFGDGVGSGLRTLNPLAQTDNILTIQGNTHTALLPANRTEQLPIPPTVHTNSSPSTTGTRLDCEPDRITSPALNGIPNSPSVLASQATALAGEPCTAAPTPVEYNSPFFSNTIPAMVMSTSRGSALQEPIT